MIGTTMEIRDEVASSLVGVDLNCGVLAVELGDGDIDFQKLDDVISERVPLGTHRHDKVSEVARHFFDTHKTIAKINLDTPMLGLGTLGGGNHHIEIDENKDSGMKYLVIHTGSRNFGLQIAEYWQSIAVERMSQKDEIDQKALIRKLKEEGRERELRTS